MKTKIDDTTGLPVLPDDMFWEVVRNDDMKVVTKTFRNYSLYLWKKRTVKKTVPAVMGRNWWCKSIVLEEEYKTTEQNNLVVESIPMFRMKDEKPEDLTDWHVRWGSLYLYSSEIPWVKFDPLTPEVIRDYAIRLWGIHINRQHEIALMMESTSHQRKQDKFVGTYPPKRLV